MSVKLVSVRRGRRRISLTPLIDVVFILLVFFMLESSFLKVRAIDLALPELGSQPMDQPLRVELLAGGMVRVNGATVGSTEWVSLLLSRGDPGNLPVLLSSEAAVPLQHMVDAMDRLQQAGFVKLALASSGTIRP